MNRQLKDHHVGTPCPVCVGLIEEIAALRLALANVVVEWDTARAEVAGLFDSPPMVARVDEWTELVGL
jgi:hypothetical protein